MKLRQLIRELKSNMKIRKKQGSFSIENRKILLIGKPDKRSLITSFISRRLSLEILRIDLSEVISKYIGETEKNLDEIFIEAEKTGALLFLDEADELFGKRSDIKDSSDRYANMEISYLLQCIQDYKGLIILASNLEENKENDLILEKDFKVIIN
jgi:SpoVK/Ycf46/Vps4 family AAA+-type ATPase